MVDADIGKLSSLVEKYRRYADISCSTLSSFVHESDILEHIDTISLENIDMKWLIPLIDGMIIITDDPKRVDLTNIEIGLMIIEILISIRSELEIEEFSSSELLDIFEVEIKKSMDAYYLNYMYNSKFNINTFEYILNTFCKELVDRDALVVVGWVNNKSTILTVVEGL